MRLRWLPAAADDLAEIDEYLRRFSAALAHRTVLHIYEELLKLRQRPYIGRTVEGEGTRELVFSPLPYLATYRIRENTIEILAVRHGAQQNPPL